MCLVTPVIKEILILIANENSVFEKKKNLFTNHFPRFIFSVAQISNEPTTWQQMLKFKRSVRMRNKGDLSDFEHCMVAGARLV